MEVGRATEPMASVAPRPSVTPWPNSAASPSPSGAQTSRSRPRPRSGDTNNQNQAANDACKVHVTGFPSFTQPQDLTRAFVSYGQVKVDKINHKFAYLSFSTTEEAVAAIQASGTINIYGEFLTIKSYDAKQSTPEVKQPQTPKREFPRSKQKGVIVDPKQIDLSGDFHQQLDQILCTVRLTQEEATAISSLYADLEKVLQALWPGCVAMPFGSITTGLGIKTSDADCFVHVPSKYHNSNANFVNKAKRILQSFPQVFAEIISIPRANTPIVKFFHIPTEINCDLSFKTPLGARNSKLISFLLHADPRLIPMAVIAKYWAKVHGFSGTGKLTNYALAMMLIFYFQQSPMSILPSVTSLQRDQAYDLIVDFWNTGFLDQKESMPHSSNTSSISELLGGFFEYYSLFNFEEMVVCPYLGHPVKKDMFKDVNQLPNEYDRYKQNVVNGIAMPMRFTTPICVQDPFEQCHNVASAITSKLAAEIKAFFKFAANAYDKEKLNQSRGFLKTILLEKPKVARRERSNPEFRVNLFPRIIANIINPDWKSIVREVINTIFEKMLKLQLGKVEEKVNPDTKKEKEKYTGTVTKAIWKRKQFTKLYSVFNLDFQQKQEKITEEIINVDKQVIDMQFQMTVSFAHDPKSVVVSIKQSNSVSEHFREFGKFFISIMQNWFVIMLKPYVKTSSTNMAAKVAETIKILDSNMDSTNNLDSDDDNETENESGANGPSYQSNLAAANAGDDNVKADSASVGIESP